MDKHKLSNKGFGFYITAAVLGIIAFFLAINTKKKKPALKIARNTISVPRACRGFRQSNDQSLPQFKL